MPVLVVLAQKILAVIVAVGRSDDHMNMVLVRFSMFAKGDTPLVVEFNNYHRTLDAVIKRTVVFYAAHPAKIRVL